RPAGGQPAPVRRLAGPGPRGRRPGAGGRGHRSHRRRRRRARPGPAGPGPDHRRGAARPAGRPPPAAGRAGPGVPGLLHPPAAARFLNPATGAGLGRLAGRAIPARRDQPTARLHRQPVPATLTTTPVPQRAPGQFRKLDAVAVLTGPLLSRFSSALRSMRTASPSSPRPAFTPAPGPVRQPPVDLILAERLRFLGLLFTPVLDGGVA